MIVLKYSYFTEIFNNSFVLLLLHERFLRSL